MSFFSFEGRARIGEFRVVHAGVWFTSFIVMATISPSPALSPAATLFALGLLLIVVYAGLATSVRRLHDRDKSGWWILVTLVPLIGTVWWLTDLGCVAGTRGPNRYGFPRGTR